MRSSVHLAPEVGPRLGDRAVLFRRLPLAALVLLGTAGSRDAEAAAVAAETAPPARLRALEAARPAQPRTPEAAVAALLAADRAASDAAGRDGLVAGLSAAMAPDVRMPVPGLGLVEGVAAVRAALGRDTLVSGARASWTPLRGGISSDALHGFTFGFIDVTRADGSVVPGKYLAYWVRGDAGWRIAAWKRVRRASGEADRTPLAPALPAALIAPVRDAALVEAHRASLLQAERDFAAASQVVGIREGFARFGSADAMNLGGPALPGFVLGNEAIADLVATGVPAGTSHVDWAPERALVATSGDLGITFGHITPNAAPPAGRERPRFPFFTIWRRAGPGAPWRYVAE